MKFLDVGNPLLKPIVSTGNKIMTKTKSVQSHAQTIVNPSKEVLLIFYFLY